ncbi:MAG TPA: hypothetical protein VJL90_14145 [Pseudorhodoplanes sp.]|nr:hypothetical protein [Pseudorhodoplanes sp.]
MLIDDVRTICDRLAPLGWRDLLMAVTFGKLDIQQKSVAGLKNELTAQLQDINREVVGFEDFDPAGDRAIVAGQPSRSLLYHALASPRVMREADGTLLKGFPTLLEIETIENFIFGIKLKTLAEIKKGADTSKLAVVVYATEYRSCPDTAHALHADLTFSRTGIARVGTARAKYLPSVRGTWPEDADNPRAFRVIPVRFTAWLAAPVKGEKARVMPLETASPQDVKREKARTFWTPVHKLFDGDECIAGLDLSLKPSAEFYNMKLARVFESFPPRKRKGNRKPSKRRAPKDYPYVIKGNLLAELDERSDFGRIAVVPTVQECLVKPAFDKHGKPQTYRVPARRSGQFATYATGYFYRNGAEVHPAPAYVHARTMVANKDVFVDLNDKKDVEAAVRKGGYTALLYVDMTGEGWVDVKIRQLVGKVEEKTRPAYVLLSAPDFFPSSGQRELSRWAKSGDVPEHFRREIWEVPPNPLSDTRKPANLQLPESPFDPKDDTMTAVIAMAGKPGKPSNLRLPDTLRASTLPDDGAGEFAPGWDVSLDVKGPRRTGIVHLAAYGLGSPFPEDVKLCAALSTFWPAVAPDVYRTMSMHAGNSWGTVAPLTDEEIGQVGSLPWDGVSGPKIVQVDGKSVVEMASFAHVDYVTNAVENRFSNRLTSRIHAREYQRRVMASARVHWILSSGINVAKARTNWLLLSFRNVSHGDAELLAAQNQAGYVFDGTVFRVEACFLGPVRKNDPSVVSPKDPRFRRVPLQQHSTLFVSAEDTIGLRRRDANPQWNRVNAE